MTARKPGDAWAARVDVAIRRRLERSVGEARRLLGLPPAPVDERDLQVAISALVQRVGEQDDTRAAVLQADHERELDRVRRRFEDRLGALSRVHAAARDLRTVTSPATMLASAARVLCDSSRFDRVLLSHVRDGAMVVASAWFRDDEEGAAAVLSELREEPIALQHPLIETEILRRRRATVVTDAQDHPRVDRRFASIMGWDSYVAAPVGVRSRIIAVMHADRGRSASVDVLDRDVLWEFASALAQSYDSASLRRTLRHERTQMRQFLEHLNARSARLNDAAIQLAPMNDSDDPAEPPREPPAHGGVALERLLTPRELEVLGLLSEGLSNRQIADELVLAEGTVKFHVNGVLRKLRVTNRAEAVARYLTIGGMRKR